MRDALGHTPTPWKSAGAVVLTRIPRGPMIADCRQPGDHGQCGENARFIVRAANSHSAMLAALEAVASLFPEINSAYVAAGYGTEGQSKLEEMVRASIAQAKETV